MKIKKLYDKEPEKVFSPKESEDAPYTPLVLKLMNAMTWAEKFALVSGSDDPAPLGQAGYLCGVPRLGVPPRRDADGDGLDLQTSQQGIFDLDVKSSAGEDVDCTNQSTSFPSRIGVAATFDRMASKAQGMVEGHEGKALGIDMLYAPQLDICRLPNFGRNNTTFGEDPYLSGQMGIGEVEGIQSQGIMAEVKHYLMYNGQAGVPFAGRAQIPTLVDDRTLHEIYLAPFEQVIKTAKPSSVMGSYQMYQVLPMQQSPNWACGNEYVLKTILRDQLKFRGFVLSDYGAAHSTDELLCGLDQQFMNAKPAMLKNFGGPYFGADLRPYVDPESSNFSLAYTQAMNRAIANVLYQYERFGLLACASENGKINGKLPERPSKDKQTGIKVSKEIADEAIVLLKNENHILPVTKETAEKGIAVIGPTARQLMSSGLDAERSTGYHDRVAISPLKRLREYFGHTEKITYAPGIDWYGKPADQTWFPNGFERKESGRDIVRAENTIQYPLNGSLEPGKTYIWNGNMEIREEGVYYFWFQQNYVIPPRFYGELWGLPQTKLQVDGIEHILQDIPVLRDTFEPGFLPENGINIGCNVRMKPGQHHIKIQTTIPPTLEIPAFQFTVSSFEESLKDAVKAAKNAETVIIFADDNGGPASIDTPTELNTLAENQDRLIEEIAKINPNTIVVISSGNLVAMPWFDHVAGVMEVWYPGQEGAAAITDILTGKVNPSGHSPLTLPKCWEDTPFYQHPERYIGKNGKVEFTDGIFVGYRWYDEHETEPLIPFGYGLSYSDFSYSNLETKKHDNRIWVKFNVKNISHITGTAVPQIYLEKPFSCEENISYAPKSLVQFERVELKPGEEKSLELEIPGRAFEHWNTGKQAWVKDKGKRRLLLGSSSAHIELETTINPELLL